MQWGRDGRHCEHSIAVVVMIGSAANPGFSLCDVEVSEESQVTYFFLPIKKSVYSAPTKRHRHRVLWEVIRTVHNTPGHQGVMFKLVSVNSV